MPGAGDADVAGADTLRHPTHLPGRGDGVLGLDQQGRRAHRPPLRPEIAPTPLLGDVAEGLHRSVQVPTVGATLEGVEEVAPGDGTEVLEHRLLGRERPRPGFDHRGPVRGGAAAEVRRHVLDDESAHPGRFARRQHPAVQGAHRMDHDDQRFVDPGEGCEQVVDERLGGQCRGRRAAVSGGVEAVHATVSAQPVDVSTPRRGAAHQPVQQQDRRAGSALVVQHHRPRYGR